MTQLNQVYKCNICGNMVEMTHTGAGTLVCCGQDMELLGEKTEEEGKEKHLPVIEKTEKGIKIKVGSVTHPMSKEHYIEWIEIIFDGKTGKKFLSPDDAPEAEFEFQTPPQNLITRCYCNVHGLWKNDLN